MWTNNLIRLNTNLSCYSLQILGYSRRFIAPMRVDVECSKLSLANSAMTGSAKADYLVGKIKVM